MKYLDPATFSKAIYALDLITNWPVWIKIIENNKDKWNKIVKIHNNKWRLRYQQLS